MSDRLEELEQWCNFDHCSFTSGRPSGLSPAMIPAKASWLIALMNRSKEDAQNRQRNRGSKYVSTPQQNLHLTFRSRGIFGEHIPPFMRQHARAVDDSAETIRHGEQKQTHTGNENDGADCNLKDRNEFLERHGSGSWQHI